MMSAAVAVLCLSFPLEVTVVTKEDEKGCFSLSKASSIEVGPPACCKIQGEELKAVVA